jgi:hypothetical protein
MFGEPWKNTTGTPRADEALRQDGDDPIYISADQTVVVCLREAGLIYGEHPRVRVGGFS